MRRMVYTETDLVRIAKRENNNKRKYLVVNCLQGKHIPVRPREAMDLFRSLGDMVLSHYSDEQLLFIGFAETATAIGASIACQCGGYYIQTTRESIKGVDYLYFSEAHSHATEQKLVKDDMDRVMGETDRIVFVEDEVTTGNTIMNIITLLKKTYQNDVAFSVASLLNGMDEKSEQIYKEQGIERLWLVKTSHEKYEDAAEAVTADGDYVIPKQTDFCEPELRLSGALDARRLVQGGMYLDACQRLFHAVCEEIPTDRFDKILVLGTEEFMFPALYTAYELEKRGADVRFHATTRSPIAVSREPGYPLHTRYQLASFYDSTRTTYLYDLNEYDKVIVISDSENEDLAGPAHLADALRQSGNRDILYVRWQQ